MPPIPISSIIRLTLTIVATFFCCVGTAIPQISWEDKFSVYLYKQGYKRSSSPWIATNDLTCEDAKGRLGAAYAFAIISCLVIGLTLVLVGFTAFLPKKSGGGGSAGGAVSVIRLLSVISSVAAVITSLITWALVVGTFHARLCGAAQSYDEAGFVLEAGAVLLIITWLLMACDALMAVLAFFRQLPWREEQGRVGGDGMGEGSVRGGGKCGATTDIKKDVRDMGI